MARTRSIPRILLLICGVVILQGLLVAWFTWPTTNARAHNLPVVVAGPAEATAGVAAKLNAAQSDAFKVQTVTDQAAADKQLKDRKAYAAIIVTATGPVVHVASAASPAVAAQFQEMAGQLGVTSPSEVIDVVPVDSKDPRGAAFLLGLLPFVLTSLIAGAVLGLLVAGRMLRLVSLVVYAALAGLAGAAVLQYWIDVLPGTYVWNAGAFALFALAVAGAVGGLGALLGAAGVGLGVLLTFVAANPVSGLTAAPELVPQPWNWIGQDLPVGAAGSLLRSVAYFGRAGGNRPALVLGIWAVVGILLLLLRSGRTAAGPVAVPAAVDTPDTSATGPVLPQQPAGAGPVSAVPVAEAPAGAETVAEAPAGAETVAEAPAATEAAPAEPVTTKRATAEPVTTEPAAPAEAATTEPATTAEPAAAEPAATGTDPAAGDSSGSGVPTGPGAKPAA